MLEHAIDPADDWLVFPTLSPEKLFLSLRAALANDGYADVELDEYLSKDRLWRLCSTYELTPDPLQTSGGRAVMKRLTEAAEIDLEQSAYLQPHGSRRGAGEVMVRLHGDAVEARLLDNTEEMVRERYSHIEAGELADVASEAFDTVDRVRDEPNAPDDRPKRFFVNCPGCGEPKGSYSTAMARAGRRCSCRIVFTIDLENRQVGKIFEK